MHTETRTTDAKARLVLPKGFANATVIIEQVCETEVRVRRAKVVPEDELPFAEESATPLSDQDRDHYRKYGFTPLLDDPLHLYLPISTVEDLL
jgi:hypothetical protein